MNPSGIFTDRYHRDLWWHWRWLQQCRHLCRSLTCPPQGAAWCTSPSSAPSLNRIKPSSFIRKTPQPQIRKKKGCDPLPSSSIDFSSTTCCSFFMLILLIDDERRDGAATLDDAVRLMVWLRPRGDGAWRSCSSPLSENEATRNSGREYSRS